MFKMFMILFVFMLLMNLMFIMIKKSIHPMVMLFILISFTLFNSIYVSKWFSSFFFSYLMFMVFIGGVLITFLYLVSLTNKDKYNIKMEIKEKMILLSSFMMLTTMITMPMMDYFNNLSVNFKLNETNNINHLFEVNENFFMFMLMMYEYMFKLTLITILVLLFMLISVVKICSKHSGPLRQIKKF